MNKELLELRGAIWHVLDMNMYMLFENVEDEEDEYSVDLEVDFYVGKYLGATIWNLENSGGTISFALYPTGALEVTLDEMSHAERKIKLCDEGGYNKIDMDEILLNIHTLVDIFLTGNYHVFHDYMSKYPTDWKKAVEEYENYLIDNPEDATIEITYISC